MIKLLPQALERSAGRAAERDAFRAPGEELTYGELAERSNQLAHLLVEIGVRRGDRVGIFMPRSVDSALAVYGILKAGAAFVPIDPHMPVGGLRSLMTDCSIEHLVAHPSVVGTIERMAAEGHTPRSVIGPAVALDQVASHPWTALAAYPAGHPPDVVSLEDDVAYLMYSSGSTGRPKGIVHTHQSGLAYVRLSVDTYDVGPDDRIGNHSPLHFDMSTFGYLSSPYAGATTVLIPEAYTKLTASLSQLMADERLTIWYSVPLALIQLLVRGVLEERDLSSLRWVLFGGEPFARQHLHALMARWPHARFSNVYGPAEVNQCTYYHLPPLAEATVDNAEPVPIGRTWAHTEGRVLDDRDQPVGAGQPGELVIHSPTMMRGYWGRPDLDAKGFVRLADDERRFYRTGDRVLIHDSGDMTFLGRMDRQVKLRGYRVELDEIERTLSSHPAVEEAAVYAVRAEDQIESLAAAVTLKPPEDIGAGELRAFLARLVSWYAVPSTFEVRSEFPRTTSGKIDRRRLEVEAEDRVRAT